MKLRTGCIAISTFVVAVVFALDQIYQSTGYVATLPESVLIGEINDSDTLSRLAVYPWTFDPECAHFPVKFAPINSIPEIALASFPGSGVTWFRQLVEGATGIFTNSVYKDEVAIYPEGHFGVHAHPDCMCTLLEKTHGPTLAKNLTDYLHMLNFGNFSKEFEWYGNAAVVLLRNPIDAAVAFRNYIGSGNNKTGIADSSWFHGAEWQAYLEFAAYAWADHAVRWIDGMQYGVVAFYENLVHDTEAELKRI